MVTPAAKRQAVAHACAVHGVSERRACRIVGFDRASMRYRSRRPDETDVRLRIRALAHRRHRFGYRRSHVLLRREGWRMNHKRFRRLYREEKLQVRQRGARKRALGVRAPLVLPNGPNERLSGTSLSQRQKDLARACGKVESRSRIYSSWRPFPKANRFLSGARAISLKVSCRSGATPATPVAQAVIG